MNCYIFFDGSEWTIQPSSNIWSGKQNGEWAFTEIAGPALPTWTHVYQADTVSGAISFVESGGTNGAAALIYAAS